MKKHLKQITEMADMTLEELDKQTCKSYGGTNCVLHQCMFGCVLLAAKNKFKKKGEKPNTVMPPKC